ncbi:pentapeptide repeat-containing protein [Sphaerisporangium perillae]|uniref:pentapeptide repeat-containing protein n=1 Tax=Sphaerisporangium perillae TaxID=2935860 RepID=UPI00200D3C6E|nr:pentapeptide repeat-containing protein [Sphaerisporangium perillae]
MQRIAADSPKDRLTIRNVLAAFVRNHDFYTTRPPASQCTAPLRDLYLTRTIKRLPSDVHEALTIASSLTVQGDALADFSETRFPRVELSKARLSRADLTRADLTFAGLWAADLTSANAAAACLTRANLTDANLGKADLRSADLYDAQLGGANLSGADLRGADLRSVSG